MAKKMGNISEDSLHRSIKKAGLTFKKKSWLYREKCEQ